MEKTIPLKWHTEKRKIKDLILYEENPREMTEKQKDDILKSLRKFNLAEIPAINTDNKVCAGNQRVFLLNLEGRKKSSLERRENKTKSNIKKQSRI